MATPQEKLAQALEALKKLQDKGFVAIMSSELKRNHRELLFTNGFIREVVRGWYIAVSPDEKQGDSTSWYASYWNFCARFLNDRHGDTYCISAEQSLMLHSGNQTVPQQLIIRAIMGTNSSTPLPHNTSLFTMKSNLPEKAEIIEKDGVKMLTLASALVNCAPTIFKSNTIDVRIALAMVQDASDILGLLLDGGHTTIAGRLAGAFRNIGREKIADEIVKTMQKAGYDIRENDPFEDRPPVELSIRDKSPYANRIRQMWFKMRTEVIKHFPKAPGIATDHEKYLQDVEDIYITDAYHSLSIERYHVSVELIEKVRTGEWDPKSNNEDKKQRDAMAARGYWLATQRVRDSIKKILNNENAGKVADDDHSDWYRELFAPSVTSGILKASDLAGYRTNQVYIGGSMHVPLNKEAVRDAMPELFQLLRQEENAAVRAVLGHFIFVYIHPYMDGNGRMGRFLMNVMLASGGYPWTVIPVEEREKYMNSLEMASVKEEIEPFANFIAWLVDAGIKGKPIAKKMEVKKERKEELIQPEFPPYKFYQTESGYKFKTWDVDLRNQGYNKIALSNILLTPIELRASLRLQITIKFNGRKWIEQFDLNDMHINPTFNNYLFFDKEKNHVLIELPTETTHVTYELILLAPIENFDMSLNCTYI